MKIKATITLLDATQSGISKSTGNPWTSKEFVIETKDENGHIDTLAVKTLNEQIIKTLDSCMKNDQIIIDLGFASKARTFTRKDGTEGVIRATEVYAKSVEVG